jgi:hypothetical protein
MTKPNARDHKDFHDGNAKSSWYAGVLAKQIRKGAMTEAEAYACLWGSNQAHVYRELMILLRVRDIATIDKLTKN